MISRSPDAALSRDGHVTLRKVASEAAADDNAVKLTLYRSDEGACGWYIGPISSVSGRFDIPYLPKSARTIASVAVVRAMRAAERAGAPICLIDPDDLWALAWRS